MSASIWTPLFCWLHDNAICTGTIGDLEPWRMVQGYCRNDITWHFVFLQFSKSMIECETDNGFPHNGQHNKVLYVLKSQNDALKR